MLWEITDKGDQDARRLADRHYSRQKPGTLQFTRNGQNLVFITEDLKAVWVTFRPTPGKAVRADKLDAWECALFRNEGPHKSSTLIREAVRLSCALWGSFPKDGFITYIKTEAVRSELKGYCYRRAGWRHVGEASDGKPMFRAPRPNTVESWRLWSWHLDRGGKLRRELEPMTSCAHDYEIQYTRKHPGKVAECGFCDAKFQEGQQLKSNLPAGYVKFNQLLKEKPVSIENAKIVKAVATINALTAEEYALVLALTERKVEKVKKERKSRKTRGQPAAPEVAETK